MSVGDIILNEKLLDVDGIIPIILVLV